MLANVLTVYLCLVGQAEPSVEELAVAHESTMAKVQAIVIESNLHRRHPNLPEEFERYDTWAKDATRIRKRFVFARTTMVDGTPLNDLCADLLDDGDSVRLLVNWDSRRMAEAAESSGVRGEILPPDSRGHGWFLGPSIMLLQHVSPKASEPDWSASEYVRAGGNAKVLPSVTLLGYKAIPVAIDHPNGPVSPGSVIKSTIYFAPELGGIVLKQVHDYPAGAGAAQPIRSAATALELQNLGGTIVLPTQIKIVTTTSGAPQRVIDEARLVSKVCVNDDVPEDAFDFRFPAGTVVTQPSAGGVEYVWGEDNEPVETRSPQPPLYAYPVIAAYLMIHDGRAMGIFLLGLGGLIAVYGTTRCLRWRQQRRQRPEDAVAR